MTREIKFRAWDTRQKKMVGDFDSGFNYRWFECQHKDCHVLMQYTGLKDKNGKEIYEGDVVQFHFKTGDVKRVVNWFDLDYAWRLMTLSTTLLK